MPRRPLSYGEIADAILPSIVLSVRVRDMLNEVVGDFVALDAQEHQAFFREQMGRIWSVPINWKERPRDRQFDDQWSVRTLLLVVMRKVSLTKTRLVGFETVFQRTGPH